MTKDTKLKHTQATELECLQGKAMRRARRRKREPSLARMGRWTELGHAKGRGKQVATALLEEDGRTP